jgi:hypothetical protein
MSMSLLQPFKKIGSTSVWCLVIHWHQVPLICNQWLFLYMLSLQVSQCCLIDSLSLSFSQLSIRVARHSEFVVTMSAQEYVHLEVEFDVIILMFSPRKISWILLVHQRYMKSSRMNCKLVKYQFPMFHFLKHMKH